MQRDLEASVYQQGVLSPAEESNVMLFQGFDRCAVERVSVSTMRCSTRPRLRTA